MLGLAMQDDISNAPEIAIEIEPPEVSVEIEANEPVTEPEPTVVIVESNDSPNSETESANQSLEFVGQIRHLVREELATVRDEMGRLFTESQSHKHPEYESSNEVSALPPVKEPVSDDNDNEEEKPKVHPWFKPIGKGKK